MRTGGCLEKMKKGTSQYKLTNSQQGFGWFLDSQERQSTRIQRPLSIPHSLLLLTFKLLTHFPPSHVLTKYNPTNPNRILTSLPKLEILDEESSNAFRKFCLSYYDIRAVIVELAAKLDAMRHLDCFPRYVQRKLSLDVLKVYAPLAHAVGTGTLSLELQDLSFRYLFPYSDLYVDTWLKSSEQGTKPQIDIYRDQLLHSLNTDASLVKLVHEVSIKGRHKSRFSTVKKLLKDDRSP